jgi:hypothetical protein
MVMGCDIIDSWAMNHFGKLRDINVSILNPWKLSGLTHCLASVTQTVFRSHETKHSLRTRERILFQWRNAFVYKRPMKFLVLKQPHTMCLFCVDISWA